jgi:hypothetical protein
MRHEIEQDEETGDASQQQRTLAFSSRNFKPHHMKDFLKKSLGQGSTKQFDCYTCGKPGHRSSECMRNPHKDLKCNRCGRKAISRLTADSKRQARRTKIKEVFKKQ